MTSSSIAESCQLFQVSRRTPAPLRAAVAAVDAEAIHRLWTDFLRKARKRLLRRRPTDALLAMWSVDRLELSGRERELAVSIEDQLRGSRPRTAKVGKPGIRKKAAGGAEGFSEILANWLVEASSPLGVWERLAVSEILLSQCARLPADVFVRALAVLSSHAGDSSNTDEPGSGLNPGETDSQSGFRISTAGCSAEADLITGLLLLPLGRKDSKRAAARKELSRMVLECTDAEGIPHGSLMTSTGELLVPLVRSLIWSRAFHQPLWNSEVQDRFRLLAEKSCMMAVRDGKMIPPSYEVSPLQAAESFHMPCLQLAARFAGFKPSGKLLQLLTACEPSSRRGRRGNQKIFSAADLIREGARARRKKTKNVAWQSDTVSVAMMRSQPSPLADLIAMEWHSAEPRICLAAFGRPILNGLWKSELQINAKPMSSVVTWNCTCWFTDQEVVFAELEAEGIPGTKLIRHVLLSTIDHFAILTDSLCCGQPDDEIQFRSMIPIDPFVSVDQEAVTRELKLRTSEFTVRVFPLWLPDDRIVSATGTISQEDDCLVSTVTGRGGVTLPLLLDWNPTRRKAPADWCRLTVSEARRNLTAQEAGAARIRIGQHQLMVYRSLMRGGVPRTVLGLHTADESVYGKVEPTGLIEALVQVQPTPDE